MAMYRCAACGSSHVVTDTKQEGYNKKKGFLGVVFFGSGGAAAGVNGNTVTYYHCSQCGQVLSYAMSKVQKDAIDYALANKENYRYIEELNNLKKKYSGIEWSDADARNAKRLQNSQVEWITNEIISECVEFIMQKRVTSHDELIAYLAQEGYGASVIQSIKSELAQKDNIPVKFMIQDNKLFYELCYDETADGTRPLGHWNRITLMKFDAPEKEKREKELGVRFTQQCSEIESGIISVLSNSNEPLTVTDMQYQSDILICHSTQDISRAIKEMAEKQMVEKVVIGKKAYYKLPNA